MFTQLISRMKINVTRWAQQFNLAGWQRNGGQEIHNYLNKITTINNNDRVFEILIKITKKIGIVCLEIIKNLLLDTNK